MRSVSELRCRGTGSGGKLATILPATKAPSSTRQAWTCPSSGPEAPVAASRAEAEGLHGALDLARATPPSQGSSGSWQRANVAMEEMEDLPGHCGGEDPGIGFKISETFTFTTRLARRRCARACAVRAFSDAGAEGAEVVPPEGLTTEAALRRGKPRVQDLNSWLQVGYSTPTEKIACRPLPGYYYDHFDL